MADLSVEDKEEANRKARQAAIEVLEVFLHIDSAILQKENVNQPATPRVPLTARSRLSSAPAGSVRSGQVPSFVPPLNLPPNHLDPHEQQFAFPQTARRPLTSRRRQGYGVKGLKEFDDVIINVKGNYQYAFLFNKVREHLKGNDLTQLKEIIARFEEQKESGNSSDRLRNLIVDKFFKDQQRQLVSVKSWEDKNITTYLEKEKAFCIIYGFAKAAFEFIEKLIIQETDEQKKQALQKMYELKVMAALKDLCDFDSKNEIECFGKDKNVVNAESEHYGTKEGGIGVKRDFRKLSQFQLELELAQLKAGADSRFLPHRIDESRLPQHLKHPIKKPFLTCTGVLLYVLSEDQAAILEKVDKAVSGGQGLDSIDIPLQVGAGKSFLLELINEVYGKKRESRKEKGGDIVIGGQFIGRDVKREDDLAIKMTDFKPVTPVEELSLVDIGKCSVDEINERLEAIKEKHNGENGRVIVLMDEFIHLPFEIRKLIRKQLPADKFCLVRVSATPNKLMLMEEEVRLSGDEFQRSQKEIAREEERKKYFFESFKKGFSKNIKLEQFPPAVSGTSRENIITTLCSDTKQILEKSADENLKNVQWILPDLTSLQIGAIVKNKGTEILRDLATGEGQHKVSKIMFRDENNETQYYCKEGNTIKGGFTKQSFDSAQGETLIIYSSANAVGGDFGEYSRNVRAQVVYSSEFSSTSLLQQYLSRNRRPNMDELDSRTQILIKMGKDVEQNFEAIKTRLENADLKHECEDGINQERLNLMLALNEMFFENGQCLNKEQEKEIMKIVRDNISDTTAVCEQIIELIKTDKKDVVSVEKLNGRINQYLTSLSNYYGQLKEQFPQEQKNYQLGLDAKIHQRKIKIDKMEEKIKSLSLQLQSIRDLADKSMVKEKDNITEEIERIRAKKDEEKRKLNLNIEERQKNVAERRIPEPYREEPNSLTSTEKPIEPLKQESPNPTVRLATIASTGQGPQTALPQTQTQPNNETNATTQHPPQPQPTPREMTSTSVVTNQEQEDAFNKDIYALRAQKIAFKTKTSEIYTDKGLNDWDKCKSQFTRHYTDEKKEAAKEFLREENIADVNKDLPDKEEIDISSDDVNKKETKHSQNKDLYFARPKLFSAKLSQEKQKLSQIYQDKAIKSQIKKDIIVKQQADDIIFSKKEKDKPVEKAKSIAPYSFEFITNKEQKEIDQDVAVEIIGELNRKASQIATQSEEAVMMVGGCPNDIKTALDLARDIIAGMKIVKPNGNYTTDYKLDFEDETKNLIEKAKESINNKAELENTLKQNKVPEDKVEEYTQILKKIIDINNSDKLKEIAEQKPTSMSLMNRSF